MASQQQPSATPTPLVGCLGLIAAVIIGGAGCSLLSDDQEPATPDPTPAQKLAALDGGNRPAADYQQLLNLWSPNCTQDQAELAGLTYAALEDLRKNGVTGETEYSVLAQLNGSTRAGTPTDCKVVAAAYLVLRERS
ncbi:hypothetical protein GCM10010193_70810 [Kitasatospora atroaurantiaca]|uniref:Uncharacterized protein n=1 Tax=Kitasatospora atroaurantiaca TaxID=285545 RepID=A0A561ENH7_9ACTN|nr:hypothetical protein [Kitasatospora atroaurantiaca]TWE17167.1 hypothetical protein FB465_2172 [Kitasatospora atroaurantiaca]